LIYKRFFFFVRLILPGKVDMLGTIVRYHVLGD